MPAHETKRIYLAASWRTPTYFHVLQLIRAAGYSVYDFRNPESAFSWDKLTEKGDYLGVAEWTPKFFRTEVTKHPKAIAGFKADMEALVNCDTCVLLMPSGRSAHIEAGFAHGAGKRLIIYLARENHTDKFEPDLMHMMADHLVIDDYELIHTLRTPWFR